MSTFTDHEVDQSQLTQKPLIPTQPTGEEPGLFDLPGAHETLSPDEANATAITQRIPRGLIENAIADADSTTSTAAQTQPSSSIRWGSEPEATDTEQPAAGTKKWHERWSVRLVVLAAIGTTALALFVSSNKGEAVTPGTTPQPTAEQPAPTTANNPAPITKDSTVVIPSTTANQAPTTSQEPTTKPETTPTGEGVADLSKPIFVELSKNPTPAELKKVAETVFPQISARITRDALAGDSSRLSEYCDVDYDARIGSSACNSIKSNVETSFNLAALLTPKDPMNLSDEGELPSIEMVETFPDDNSNYTFGPVGNGNYVLNVRNVKQEVYVTGWHNVNGQPIFERWAMLLEDDAGNAAKSATVGNYFTFFPQENGSYIVKIG